MSRRKKNTHCNHDPLKMIYADLEAWCANNDANIQAFGEGRLHWQIVLDGERKPFAEWWPKTGRMVIRQNWERPYFFGSSEQIITALDGAVGKREQPISPKRASNSDAGWWKP